METPPHDDHSRHHFLFGRSLPFEILSKVFSMMTQAECLKCMSVCRSWNTAIPHYTRECFRTVILKGSKHHAHNTRLQQCLGPHVGSAVVDACDTQDQLDALLAMLARSQCDNVRQLCIRYCTVDDGETLVQRLRQFERLERIAFHGTRIKCATFRLLRAVISGCRTLTHVTCNTMLATVGQEDDDSAHQASRTGPEDSAAINRNMRFLRIGLQSNNHTVEHVLILLLLCPNLRYLSTACNHDLDSRMLLVPCPRLAFLEWHVLAERYLRWLHHPAPEDSGADHTDDDVEDPAGTRHPDRSQPYQWLEQQSSKIQSTSMVELSLQAFNIDDGSGWTVWTHPLLQRLEIRSVSWLEEQGIGMLLQCAPALRKIRLEFVDLVFQLPSMLRPLAHLRSVHLLIPEIRVGDEGDDPVAFFRGFQHLPQVTDVSIECAVHRTQPPHSIHDMLMAMSGIPQLKHLDLSSHYNVDDLLLVPFFARAMHLESLSLKRVSGVTNVMLTSIADFLHRLTSLEIISCETIESANLRAFVARIIKTRPALSMRIVRTRLDDDGECIQGIESCLGSDRFSYVQAPR